jgi:peptidylprolyl isomerase
MGTFFSSTYLTIRPASAGKPRIPGGVEVVFDVEICGLPGKEPELIDLIGDD